MPAADDDEPFLWWLALLIGSIRVGIAVFGGESWGGEASVAALLIVAGVVGLVRRANRATLGRSAASASARIVP